MASSASSKRIEATTTDVRDACRRRHIAARAWVGAYGGVVQLVPPPARADECHADLNTAFLSLTAALICWN